MAFTIVYESVTPNSSTYVAGTSGVITAVIKLYGHPNESYEYYVGLTIKSPSGTNYDIPLIHINGALGPYQYIATETIYFSFNVPNEIGNYSLLSCVWSPEDIIGGTTVRSGAEALVCYPGEGWSPNAFTVTAPVSPAEASISSLPSGAEIYLDGADTGYTTPHIITAEPGQHIIGLVLSGYEPYSHSYTLLSGSQTLPTITLTPQSTPPPPPAGTGNLIVNSIPSGAEIYFDGVDTGYQTNFVLTGLMPGNHIIECRLAGYVSNVQSVTVPDGDTATITIPLTPSGGGEGPGGGGGLTDTQKTMLLIGGGLAVGIGLYYLTKK